MHPFYSANSQLLGDEGSAWIGLLSMAMYLIFWAAVLVIVLKIFRKYFVRNGHLKAGRDTAMDILRERYAKGEIDEETFRRMKAELKEKD
ncbi:MAG TPA: SHOCT domain-containing protein [Clostridiaceae bacterium]|nr:SHOCT domain-containing protein [Clostridiaceae bacterium]